MFSTLVVLGTGAVIGHYASRLYAEWREEQETGNLNQSVIGRTGILFQSGISTFRPPPRNPTPDVTDFEMVEKNMKRHDLVTDEPSMSMMLEDPYDPDGIYTWR